MAKRKQHWYVGEIVSSIFDRDILYEVISAINSKEKYKNGYPKGYTKPKSIVWYYQAREITTGFIYEFLVAQVDEDERRVLHTLSEERLWNL